MSRFVSSRVNVLILLVLGGVLAACGSDSSNGQHSQNDQAGQQSPVEVTHALDGDLTYVLEGSGTHTIRLRVKEMEDENGSFEIDAVDPNSIKASLSNGRASGDLPDVSDVGGPDDPKGFEVYKLLTFLSHPDKDLTLKLLNDGTVVATANAPAPGDDMSSGQWIIKVTSPNAGS